MTRVILASVIFSGVMAAFGQSSPPASMRCPSTATAEKVHDFERVSVLNIDNKGREYDLAPDDEKQTGGKTVQVWNLKQYRSMTILLRCRYHDTAMVLDSEAPATLTRCTFTFVLDKKGNFLGKSDLLCR